MKYSTDLYLSFREWSKISQIKFQEKFYEVILKFPVSLKNELEWK